MPIYGVKVRGDEKERIVRASSAAKARDHVVEAKALNAEELADAIGNGAAIETASEGEAEASPAPADPPASEEKPAADEAAKGK
jgi:hypothetical protein